MKIYLDEDSSSAHLVQVLRRAGHDIQTPLDHARTEDTDPQVLRQAILAQRVLISHNHDDFKDLHDLLVDATGHHPGILIVCKENDPTRDMTPGGVVRALQKLEQSEMPILDSFYVLNHWR